MGWTYSDYESQATPALRLTKLRLHINEVNAVMGKELTVGMRSERSESLQTHLEKTLYPRLRELEKDADSDRLAESSRVKAGFTRGRPL